MRFPLAILPLVLAVPACSESHVVPIEPLPDCSGSLAAPRLVAPLSTSTSTSRSPRLTIEASGEAAVEVCADRACAEPIARIAAGGPTARAPRLAPGTYFWRARSISELDGVECAGPPSATWQITIGARDAGDTAWGAAIDPDGDGLADVLARGVAGAAVRLGPALDRELPLPRDASWPASAVVGAATSIGDVSGDGLTDLVAIVALADGAHLFLYRGAIAGPTLGPDVTGILGDVVPARSLLETTFAGVGDVDGDGYGDLAAYEAPWAPLVLLGGPDGLDVSRRIELDRDASGYVRSLASGDVDGDGLSDVVVGSDYGRMGVFYGDREGALERIESRTHPLVLYLGTAITIADWNGDGHADAIAATGNGDETAAYVYLGSPDGIAAEPAMLGWRSEAERAFEWLGLAAGDVDGDGRDDVAGVGGDRPEAVSMFLARGSEPARVSDPVAGRLVVLDALGDVQGDGLADFAATFTDGTPTTRTEVYFGSPGGLTRGPVIER